MAGGGIAGLVVKTTQLGMFYYICRDFFYYAGLMVLHQKKLRAFIHVNCFAYLISSSILLSKAKSKGGGGGGGCNTTSFPDIIQFVVMGSLNH